MRAKITGTPTTGNKYFFTEVPNLSRNNIILYGFELFTATQLVRTPQNEPVIAASAQDQVVITWRDNKKHSHEKIPQTLLDAALKLSNHYGSTQVRRRLGISNAQLKRLQSTKLNKSVDFIDVPQLKTASRTDSATALCVEIHTPSGTTITLSGLPDTQPLPLIAKLIGGDA